VRVVIDEVPRFLERLDRSIDAEMAATPQDGAAPQAPNLTGDMTRQIARSARTSASDAAGPEEYVAAGWSAALAALAAGSPVATIRTWHMNGEQQVEAWEWLDAIATLPDGVHRVYASPAAPAQAPSYEAALRAILAHPPGSAHRIAQQALGGALYSSPVVMDDGAAGLAIDGLRYRAFFDFAGRMPVCFQGQEFYSKADCDAAIDAAIAEAGTGGANG
jgi:hypothetical protein